MTNQEDKQLNESKKQLSKNVVAQFGLQLAKYVIPFITLPYLARVLSVDGYGVRAYVLSVMTIVTTILDFGFMISATKDVSNVRDDKEKVAQIIGEVIEAKLLLFVVIGIGLIPVCVVIPLLCSNAAYVAIAYLATAINSLIPDYVFMGYEKMSIMTTRYIVSKLIGLVLTFLLIRSPHDLLLLPVIDTVTSTIAVIWTFVGMRRRLAAHVRFPILGNSINALRKSAVVFVSNLASTLFNSYTMLAIGVIFNNASDVAVWSLSTTVISVVQSLYSPIYNSVYSYMVAQYDLRLFKKLIKFGLLGVTILSIGVGVFSEFLMCVLGGEEYLYGSYLIVCSVPVIWFSFFSLLFGWPLLGVFGFEKSVTTSTLVSGFVSVSAVTTVGLIGVKSLAVYAGIRWLTEAMLAGARGLIAFLKRERIREMARNKEFERKANEGVVDNECAVH